MPVATRGPPCAPKPTGSYLFGCIARIRWVYATDGPFALSALVGVVQFIFDYEWKIALGTFLAAAYVLGNIIFLDAMRRRDALLVRIGIVANNAFAIGMAPPPREKYAPRRASRQLVWK